MTWLCLAQPREELPPRIWEDPSLQQIVEDTKNYEQIMQNLDLQQILIEDLSSSEGLKLRNIQGCDSNSVKQTVCIMNVSK